MRSTTGSRRSGFLHSHATQAARVLLAATAALIAGCSTPPAALDTPPADLTLQSAAALNLPRDCAPAVGQVYRARFVVNPDGAVADVRLDGRTDCAADALRQWVGSFRYLPPNATVASVIDWMPVVASKGS